MPLAYIPFTLLVIPILEIAVFILVGNQIGLWPTLGMIVVTAFIGTLLLRHQGFQLLREIKAKTQVNEMPERALVHGVMLLVAGVLLLTPGFVTDSAGFSLFIPPIRDFIWNAIKSRINFTVAGPGDMDPGRDGAFHKSDDKPQRPPTIDLDESDFGPRDPHSPWNK